MPLTNDEIKQLKALLSENRGPTEKGGRQRIVREPTDESKALVLTGASNNDRSYHAYADGEPACGGKEDGEYIEWDMDEADEWHKPCGFCFPERRDDVDADEGDDA